MRRAKLGLADLKKLHQEAQSPDPPSKPAKAKSRARKRSPFLPPSPSSQEKSEGATRLPAAEPIIKAPAATPAFELSEADRRLFLQAVRHVERIKDPGRVLLPPVAVAPDAILEEKRKRAAGLEAAAPVKRKRESKGDEPQKSSGKGGRPTQNRPLSDNYAPATHDQDDSRYLKAGHGSDILKDLKRGKWMIGASLDLHGATLEDARDRFDRFLTSCLTHDVRCVRIVHGKGYGSRNGDAVLKTTVRRWLTQVDEVIAYTECSEADGGAGAVQVLLK